MLAQWFSKFASPSFFSSFGILRVKVHGNAPYHNFKPVLMNLAGGNIIIVLAIPLHIWILYTHTGICIHMLQDVTGTYRYMYTLKIGI
jgi:hypothetical protein